MNTKTIMLLASGFGFGAVSRALEARGDLAPWATSGISHERLVYHGAALVVLVIALVCFVAALMRVFKKHHTA